MTISIANSTPVAADDEYSTWRNSSLVTPASGVLANDADANGDPLTVAVVTPPSNGTVSLGSDGSFTYTPTAGFIGIDSFTYAASDGTSTSSPATVSVSVTNRAPTAPDLFISGSHDHVLQADAAHGVLGGASDPDGDPLSAILVSGPAHGTLVLSADGSFGYSPVGAYVGPDGFVADISDGLTSVSVTVAIQVTNATPVAVTRSGTIGQDGSWRLDPPGLLSGGSDADGDTLTVVLISAPRHGTLVIESNGRLTYQPDPAFSGVDSFTYALSDGITMSAAATVTIHVVAPVPPATQTPDPTDPPSSPAPSATPAPPTAPPGPSTGPSAGGGDAFALPRGAAGLGGAGDLGMTVALLGGLGMLLWAVPGLSFTVSGLIVIIAIMAQTGGGLIWLPVARRKIGSFGLRFRRSTAPSA